MRILIVEDEKAISDVISAYLKKEGYETDAAPDGLRALELFNEGRNKNAPHDLIILDLMLPRLPGEEVCKQIRASSNVPIIMLTAKGSESDVIAGLDAGADDYVIKPFSPRVLVARVRAHLRGSSGYENAGDNSIVIKIGDLDIDLTAREIRRGEKAINVTRNEFLVFSTLASKPEKTFSRDELISKAFGDDYDGFDRTIDTYVKNLRRKLGDDNNNSGYIRTVHGFGYRVAAE
ncbi:MAG: response regulator transcription factor [Synergistaceae bacterium]|nr:response regulator transcription factor [Synergistaceae bacterium]